MSPNFAVCAAPNGKFQLFCGGGPRKTQFHGGFLADDVEVRRAERGIKPNGKMNRIPFVFIANFLLFAEGKTSKFPVKESDNFCPKAIKNDCNPVAHAVIFKCAQIGTYTARFCTIQIVPSEEQLLLQVRVNVFVRNRVAPLRFIT